MARDGGRVVCIGNAALDRTFAVTGPLRLATSNPARVRASFGGVARNVAENLARLGVATALLTQLGDDAGGLALRDDCARVGVDVRGVLFSKVHPTSEYVAIIDAAGELVVGASVTAAIDALTVSMLGAALGGDTPTAWTFADCTLPAPVLAALLAQRCNGGPRLAIDAVSTAKAQHLPRDLRGLDVLFLNEDEARALLGDEAPDDARRLARALRERGAEAVVLTRGVHGAILADAGGATEIAAPATAPVDVTGAGDALIAGTLVALLTIESPATVSRSLTRAALAALRARAGAPT